MVSTYPLAADYITAIRHASKFVLDPVLRSGTPLCPRGVSLATGDPLLYSGGFAKVFVMDCGGRRYAVRCWTMDIGDIARHYQAITACLAQVKLPYFAEFAFVPQGIMVNGTKYPILRMGWVQADSLREFIGAHRRDRQVLAQAAEAFRAMCATLHQHRLGHGDLQSDNIKVQRRGSAVEFTLIDYDTLFVPMLDGTRVTNVGLPAYQHPARAASRVTSGKDDYFSELVIYLTLLAVADDPALWDDYNMAGRDKELLFAADDYQAAAPTGLLRRLRALSPTVGRLTLVLWNFTRCRDIQQLIPLEDAVRLAQTAASPPATGTSAPRGNFDLYLASMKNRKEAPAPSSSWLAEWPASAATPVRPVPSRPPPTAQPQAWTKVKLGNAPAPPPTVQTTPRPAATSFQTLLRGSQEQGQVVPPSSPPPLPGLVNPPPGPANQEKVRGLVAAVVWCLFIILMLWSCSHVHP